MSISSTENFASSFMEFRRMSDQNDKMKSWLKEKLDECIEGDSLTGKEECRILGVGSGVGEIDCFICENLQKKQKNIFVRVLEPNAVEMNHFNANVCSNKCLDVVKFYWRQVDALDYFKETRDKRFHIIHLFHVLYYFKGNEMNVIQQCFNQLEVGGRLLIIQASASNGLLSIRKAFAKELCSLEDDKFNRVSGEDLLFIINRLRYKYHSDNIRSSLDVSQCLADPKSKTGSLLWDFLTGVDKFVETSPNLVLQIRNMLTLERPVIGDKTCIPMDSIGISIQKTHL
ncbi:histamine N-methyltransferase-like [Antedon mediterranea]|uniref:histamine N-methyltransferase-like n=1 Tax=Antedon mediterranea TaxID=105859 RepID=UPI003AF9AD63